ncbi:MAG: hypothetical protein A2046_07100 [Bacteroidetes bacterium GWA2_30_7]|nr:MAG: hypothetical protein A2046_07100 [Bacteroidetes bacterium GWA2_30_7]
MVKALFLDRDGVVNFERSEYTFRLEDFTINNGIIELLLNFQKDGFLIIIISNQGGISKGIYKKEDVEKLHNKFIKECKSNNINITDFFYCPHFPEIENCLCRKPKSLMLEKAIAKYNINITESLMIGDSERDMECAENVGIKGILIKSNKINLKILNPKFLNSKS